MGRTELAYVLLALIVLLAIAGLAYLRYHSADRVNRRRRAKEMEAHRIIMAAKDAPSMHAVREYRRLAADELLKAENTDVPALRDGHLHAAAAWERLAKDVETIIEPRPGKAP